MRGHGVPSPQASPAACGCGDGPSTSWRDRPWTRIVLRRTNPARIRASPGSPPRSRA